MKTRAQSGESLFPELMSCFVTWAISPKRIPTQLKLEQTYARRSFQGCGFLAGYPTPYVKGRPVVTALLAATEAGTDELSKLAV